MARHLGDRLNILKKLEARPRIELGCKDLQSSASPLRHRASLYLHTGRAL